jgi:hypothetical protein
MIHTRRAIETLTMSPQGIVTTLCQRDKMRRGRPPHGKRTQHTQGTQRIRDFGLTGRLGVLFGVFFFYYYFVPQSPTLCSVTPQSHY